MDISSDSIDSPASSTVLEHPPVATPHDNNKAKNKNDTPETQDLSPAVSTPESYSNIEGPVQIDMIKSDLNSKFAADRDEEAGSEAAVKDAKASNECKRSTFILALILGLLVVAAVVVTVVLLTSDNGGTAPAMGSQMDEAQFTPISPSTPGTAQQAPSSPTAQGSPVAPVAPVPPTKAPIAAPTTAAPTRSPTQSPTASPTAAPTVDLRQELLKFLFTQNVFVDDMNPTDPTTLAADWMADEAAARGLASLDVSVPDKVVQRFVLLTLDFALQGSAPSPGTQAPTGVTTGAVSPLPGTQAPTGGATGAVSPFFGTQAPTDGATDASSQVPSDGSNSFMDEFWSGRRRVQQSSSITPAFAGLNRDECLWNGVICDDNGIVTELRWGDQGLEGTIPSEVGLLKTLKHLDISQNDLHGSIPESLYGLLGLEELYLYQNQLTGTISSFVGDLWNLTTLHLSHNQIGGSIPATMASGDSMRPYHYINFYRNQLTGTIPDNLRWRQLFYLDLGHNQLTGTLPDDIGERCVALRHLHLDHNNFRGTLPSSYINVGNGRLEQLTINDNRLTGAVPSNHEFFWKLIMFTLEDNDFDQSLSSGTCRLSVGAGGENVELVADCDICSCRGSGFGACTMC